MVRINIIPPVRLMDQHLIAEYNEILMLFGYVTKYPKLERDKIPPNYCLGPGHILFFKNKLGYLKNRFEQIKKEMIQRNFHPKKSISLWRFNPKLIRNWSPKEKDIKIITARLIEKVKHKPHYYTYYHKHYSVSKLLKITNKKTTKNKITSYSKPD